MASTVNPQLVKKQTRRKRVGYPLSQWFDGRAWRLVQGHDFKATVPSMVSQLRRFARNLQIRIHIKVEEAGLIVQAER